VLWLLAALVFVEDGLRFKEHLRNPRIDTIPDEQLGVRFRANAQGMDANGYRNHSVPTAAEIVTLGDSVTWGVNATLDATWPSDLERLSGRSVYNMSVGGWSMAQYDAALGGALMLRPRIVVVALFFGNDLWETYRSVYTLDGYRPLRHNEPMLDVDSDPVERRAAEYWRSTKGFLDSYGSWPPTGWPGWALRHTAIGRLSNRALLSIGVAEDAWFEAGAAWAMSDPDDVVKCRTQGVSTILTPGYRLLSLNLDEPRIREGLRLTKELFNEINARAKSEPVRLLYVLIPTKEHVFDGCLDDARQPPTGALATVVRNEDTIRSVFMTWCAEQNATCLDVLRPMQAAIRAGQQIYPRSEDGHPNAAGYSVIARSVDEALRSFGWGPGSAEPAIVTQGRSDKETPALN